MPSKHIILRATPERRARLDELGRRIRSESDTEIIDYALGAALENKEGPQLSRQQMTVITYSQWERDPDDVWWLTLQTSATENRRFRQIGSDEANLPANESGEWAQRFALGNTVKVGDLHGIPVISDLLAGIESGINIHVGTLDDGLTDLCGKLVFARVINNSPDPYYPSRATMATAWEAAEIFGRDGKQTARAHLEGAGYEVFEFRVGGPGLNDDCVMELR